MSLKRTLTSWYAPAALAAVVLLGLALWVRPVRIERVVTDSDGGSRTVTGWDTSRWQAVSAYSWQALLLALAFALVLAVAWYARGWVIARASAARFFAASLLVHCLLVLSLGAVPLARAVVEQAEIIRVSQAAQLFEDPKPARPAYEKVADPRPEKAATPVLVRQPAPALPVPEGMEVLVPTVPMEAARRLPPGRLLFVPARPALVGQPLQIQRRVAGRTLKPAEVVLDTPELPAPQPLPREQPLLERRVTLARREPAAPLPSGPEPLRLPEPKRPRPADLRPDAAPPMRTGTKESAKLPRRMPPARQALAAPREADSELKAEPLPSDRPPQKTRVTLPRLAPPPARMPDEPGRPLLPLKQPARVRVPPPLPIEVKPSPDFPPERLPRRVARADQEARIEDKAAVAAPLLLRQKEERQRSVALYGGTKESEAAVERGLDWLAAHQNGDGSWGLNNFHARCKHPRCGDAGTVVSDPAGTGVALLPFLGAGHTPASGKHRHSVARALHWLVSQQRPEGTWPAPQDSRPMYGHAIASIALCEAYGMTQDAKLKAPAQKAIDYIVKAQHPGTGGWRYQPNQPADTSVVGWQVMALKSGEMAGLSVPPRVFEGVKRWLSSVEANRPVGGRFGYQSGTARVTPAMTAQGLLCLQYLGIRRNDPRLRAGTDYLLANLPRAGAETSYYWYHATQVMYHVQGKHWKAWNDRLRDLLVRSQETKGTLAGSWKPVDAREKPGGRLYATALRLLMLEVYYRHLPLYRQLEK